MAAYSTIGGVQLRYSSRRGMSRARDGVLPDHLETADNFHSQGETPRLFGLGICIALLFPASPLVLLNQRVLEASVRFA